IAGTDSRRDHREVECGGSGSDSDGVGRPAGLRELLLEAIEDRAADESRAAHHLRDRRIDLRLDARVLRAQVTKRDLHAASFNPSLDGSPSYGAKTPFYFLKLPDGARRPIVRAAARTAGTLRARFPSTRRSR